MARPVDPPKKKKKKEKKKKETKIVGINCSRGTYFFFFLFFKVTRSRTSFYQFHRSRFDYTLKYKKGGRGSAIRVPASFYYKIYRSLFYFGRNIKIISAHRKHTILLWRSFRSPVNRGKVKIRARDKERFIRGSKREFKRRV